MSPLRYSKNTGFTRSAGVVLVRGGKAGETERGFWSSSSNLKAHSRRLRIASQTVSRTLARAYRLQFDSTIVHGA